MATKEITAGLVSIIVPIYNTEKYLNRCLESIVNQTYYNLEILLINDGSPDRCPQMCDEWARKDSRIRVFHKENEGLGMARNTGIENATGEYVCFFDSDDYVALDTIEKAYAMISAKKADIVVFGNMRVDKNGKIVKCNIPEPSEGYYSGIDVLSLFLPDLIDCKHENARNKNLCLSACVNLFSMDLITRTEWHFVSEREIISEDSYSLIWLYQHVSSVAILPEALYYHCENTESLTQVYREDRFDKIKLFYKKCCKNIEAIGYGVETRKSVSGLFLSLCIGTMKQIIISKKSVCEKRKLLKRILHDGMIRGALEDIADRKYSIQRQILYWCMCKKQILACYIMLVAKTRKG